MAPGTVAQHEPASDGNDDLFLSRLNVEADPEASQLSASDAQKHADLLERVIKFGLNQSQYLIEVQVGS
jgi:hypothetical protein